MKALLYRLRNRTAALIHDLLMVPVAWLGALWFRFNLESIPDPYWTQALVLLPAVLAVHGACFMHFGLYRGIWRFASIPDFVRILKAVFSAMVASVAVVFVLTGMQDVPRAVFLMHSLLLLTLLCLPRFLYRWLKDHKYYFDGGTRVLIVGAGQAGEMLARDLVRDGGARYWPVGFVDDDPRKRGTEVRGVPVLGETQDIPELVDGYQVDQILIAMPSASSGAMRRVVGHCEASGRPFRTLPRWSDLLDGRVTLRELRDVSIEDLLGREPVRLDWEEIRAQLSGRVVLVTGGGGSIGSELCRQLAALGPSALIILERSEFNLYQIRRELGDRFPGLVLHPRLGDVCDPVLVEYVMARYQPQVVFHAAAYKHVPLLEQQAREAIRNNVFGTVNMAEAAHRHGCQRFVLISTDKAVNPTSVMGVSKQLAEIVCQTFNPRSATRFVVVRFGNVLGSAGSVVPLFQEQIRNGGPVTVTHPEISRYFMTIPEASQLILQAGAVGKGGEIYVLDMGEPIRIQYLAEQMIMLSGKTPGRDIEIVISGLRPGEKLHEELFHDAEDLIPTRYPKLRLAHSRKVDSARLSAALEGLKLAIEGYDDARVRDLALGLVVQLDPTVVQARSGLVAGG